VIVDTPVNENNRFPMHVAYQGIALQAEEKTIVSYQGIALQFAEKQWFRIRVSL
jgi:hypothetical protein